MSALAANLCLFGATLCNVAMLDKDLFENRGGGRGGPPRIGNGALINAASNIFGAFGGFLGAAPPPRPGPRNNAPPHDSPCERKFQYVQDDRGGEWEGIIKLKNINVNHDTVLEADFILPQGLPRRSYNGGIRLVNSLNSVGEDLARGLPLLFEVNFASQNPVPKLYAIYKNNRRICSGPIDSQRGVSSFRVKYKLQAPRGPLSQSTDDSFNSEEELEANLAQEPQSNPQGQPQGQPQVRPQENPQFPIRRDDESTAPQSNPNQFQNDASVCGIPVTGFTQSLVIGGQSAGRGEWPWLMAFYRSSSGNLEFICGSSLIASSYAVTAAHCIQDKGKSSPMPPKEALLFAGKHNLIEWNEQGYVKKGARKFNVHPEWNPRDAHYDADIALIEMDSPIAYSKFIRPICLWDGSTQLSDSVGKTGIVAGWGKNDDGKLNTDFPKKVNVPIVSDGQCLRTHEAFVHITSNRTFCAGGRKGEGPCQGDSGGGLVLKEGRKWFLRGVVSASLRDGTSCDVNSYAVFTDVAKFLPWIKNILN